MSKPLYVCDPNKNTQCEKTSCGHNINAVEPCCFRTTNKEFAVDDAARYLTDLVFGVDGLKL